MKKPHQSIRVSIKSRALTSRQRVTFADKAYQRLRRLILDNQLLSGYQITEQELARRLDMSRTPVREAMLQLASEGLVEVKPRHGMRVLPVSADDMRDIYQLLRGLESVAIMEVAARGVSKTEQGELENLLDEMETRLFRQELTAWADRDHQFHLFLVSLCANERLYSVVENALDQSNRIRKQTLESRRLLEVSNQDHRELVGAIVARDREQARKCIESHRQRNGSVLIELCSVLDK